VIRKINAIKKINAHTQTLMLVEHS